MALSLNEPRVKNSAQGLILSYELPQRTYTVTAHPIESSNGSIAILHGHQYGVRITWRGGKHFKHQAETATHIQNGASNSIILIDSDDETPPATHEIEAEFEDEEEEYKPSLPYPGIRQFLDLSLGSSVLQIAVLPPSVLKSDQFALKNRIVFVAACSDFSVRLITLPLTPPSPSSKSRSDLGTDLASANAGHGKWGEKITILNGHNRPSDGVSLTIDSSSSDPHYIIASHSREVNGRLLLWRYSLQSQLSHVEPFQSIFLASPAKSISFNPSPSNSNYLLVAETAGACRIYDFNDSKSQPTAQDGLAATQGNWLLSLFTGFKIAQADSLPLGTHARFGRKAIVDAQWISNGRAIIVLLDDGEWGVWDVECSGSGVPQSFVNCQGIKGGSISEYSFTGFIHSTNKSYKTGPLQNVSKFAPMTPGTRKSIDPFTMQSAEAASGQIFVMEMPSSSSTIYTDEAVLLRLGETYALIPSVSKFSAAQGGKESSSNLFGGDTGGRIINLAGIDLQGERCSAVSLIPSKRGKFANALLPDVVILGEHRFLILNSNKFPAQSFSGNSTSNGDPIESTDIIENGGLNVQGIEMALDIMQEKNGAGIRRMVPL
ncbi:hypothetical protein K3495_g7696 [Podosphaera aphanis]|nr:hypothetical protein K3495_g7696 [Podosphaera aphanis]